MYNNTSEIYTNVTSSSTGLRLVDIIYVPLEIILMIFICTGNLLVITVVTKYKVCTHFCNYSFYNRAPLSWMLSYISEIFSCIAEERPHC